MKKRNFYPGVVFFGVFILHTAYFFWKANRISRLWIATGEVNYLASYFKQQDFFLGLSYALAGAFTAWALLNYFQNRRGALFGIAGGITLTGVLAFAGCFLAGCCGSPMLAIYLSWFGPSILGFTKPLTLLLTAISIGIGIMWIKKKSQAAACNCGTGKPCSDAAVVIELKGRNPLSVIQRELQEAIALPKCQKCGCMKEALEDLKTSLPALRAIDSSTLLASIENWLMQMQPVKYDCLGCDYCYPAVALNVFNQAFPEAAQKQALSCGFEVHEHTWPAVPGEYFVFCEGESCPVAVSTLASVELAERLAGSKPKELCIVGKTETENIGIDKIIKNTITNPTIKVLLLAGNDSPGHQAGKSLLCLWENGIDEQMRVIRAPGKRSVLRNVGKDEVEAFRKQVQVVDLIGCEDTDLIIGKIKEIAQQVAPPCNCHERSDIAQPVQISPVPVIKAQKPIKVQMDKAGYFVIIPQAKKNLITVEHYSYNDKLLNIIEGEDARSIYSTIIKKRWITQMSHAAYVGKELEKAELSIKFGFKYVQDGA